jgi:hypothetical protein
MPQFAAGKVVRLFGLKTKPELNNAVGTIVLYDRAKDRYAVKVHKQQDDGAAPLLLKASNLLPVDADNAEVKIDYDALLIEAPFVPLKLWLLGTSVRPGTVAANIASRSLTSTRPSNGSPSWLHVLVELVATCEEHSAPLVQQACDAISKLCTNAFDARHAVRASGAATALVRAIYGGHGIDGVGDASAIQSVREKLQAAREKNAAELGAAAAHAASKDEESLIVDVTEGELPSSSPKASTKDADGADDAAKAVLAAPTPQDPLVVSRACCFTLTNLANGDLLCKQAVVEAGGAAALASVLNAMLGGGGGALDDAKNDGLVKACVGGLANIAGGDDVCAKAVIDAGGVRGIVRVAKFYCSSAVVDAGRHGAKTLIIGDACLALANLACDKKHGALAVVDEGGVSALVGAAGTYGTTSARVCEWSAIAFANLASVQNGDVSDVMVDEGVPRTLSSLLAASANIAAYRAEEAASVVGSVRAQRFAIGTFKNLAQDEDGREACYRAGLVEATAKALMQLASTYHGGKSKGLSGGGGTAAAEEAAQVAEQACRAFGALAFGDAEGKARLRESGVNRVLTAVLDAFPAHGPLQEMGRAVIAEFS